MLAQPLNNIGPTKELIKPIFGQEAVACFSRWPYYLWFSGTLITKELYIISSQTASQKGKRNITVCLSEKEGLTNIWIGGATVERELLQATKQENPT